MKIAIDVDNTITRNPRAFKELALALKKQGHIIIILTGNGGNEMPRDKRLNQLNHYNFTDKYYDELVIAEGKDEAEVSREKARILRELNIDVFIDDNIDYIKEARKLNPDLLILRPC